MTLLPLGARTRLLQVRPRSAPARRAARDRRASSQRHGSRRRCRASGVLEARYPPRRRALECQGLPGRRRHVVVRHAWLHVIYTMMAAWRPPGQIVKIAMSSCALATRRPRPTGKDLGERPRSGAHRLHHALNRIFGDIQGEPTGLDHSNVERSFRVPTTISSFTSGTPSSGKFRWHDAVAHEIC
jgi:hypothetical protein